MDDDIITDTGMDQQKPPSKVSRPALQCLLLTQLETKSLCTSDVPTLKGSKANPASASDSKNPNLWSLTRIGQSCGSGCRQCKAAAQAAECAAMGSRCV